MTAASSSIRTFTFSPVFFSVEKVTEKHPPVGLIIGETVGGGVLPGGSVASAFYSLEAPRLRTRWTIQQATLTMGIEALKGTSGGTPYKPFFPFITEQWEATLYASLFIDSIAYPVAVVGPEKWVESKERSLSPPNLGSPFSGCLSEVKQRKVYGLEPFSGAVIPGGHSMGIGFSIETTLGAGVENEKAEQVGSLFFKINEPLLQVTVNQEFSHA